ncbi:copper chaperone PCu(A)C [Paraburkholderia franconis]|uniref:copper chaperone PCu(A)C n=1 Tax=Paraburkholderia franconis TaxID=2654983 RepID=UPI00128C8A45|nr:copper chaperone PCu(A)C [Paraburkholderia franconis]
MKTPLRAILLAVLCGCAGTTAAAPASVKVSGCWIRLLPGNLPSGGYFSVMNMGAQPVDLTGVRTDAYGTAMLHQTRSNGSTSNMVMVDKVTVPAHGTLAFTPGGYHVMLEQPKTPLKVGMSIPFTFVFSDGEQVSAECETKSATAMGH